MSALAAELQMIVQDAPNDQQAPQVDLDLDIDMQVLPLVPGVPQAVDNAQESIQVQISLQAPVQDPAQVPLPDQQRPNQQVNVSMELDDMIVPQQPQANPQGEGAAALTIDPQQVNELDGDGKAFSLRN